MQPFFFFFFLSLLIERYLVNDYRELSMSKNWGASVCQLPCKAVIVSNPSLPLFHSAPLLKQMSCKVKMIIVQAAR